MRGPTGWDRGLFRRSRTRFLAALILSPAAAPASAEAQLVTVRGTVVERASDAWVGAATVQLSGVRPYITDLDGRFELFGVRPGRHTLTVQALGYRTRTLELDLTADTSLVVEMDPDPILLDSLLVRAGSITIRGEITDGRNGQRILYAQVTVLPGFPTRGAVSGEFTVGGVPAGRSMAVLVEAVGYLPARIALITETDTTLAVELEPDPVGQHMLAQQVEKLEERSQGLPFPRRVSGQEELASYPGMTAFDIVDRQLRMFGRRGPGLSTTTASPCLFIDDLLQTNSAVLWSLTTGELERIEIYDRGRMIRVYTKPYLIQTVGKEPGPIVYMKIGLGGNAICR